MLLTFQFRFKAPGDDMLHSPSGICAVIDSKLDQLVQPNSDRYHPSCPGPVKAGTAVGSFELPPSGGIGCAFGITTPSTSPLMNAV
jgi:hypothetical protein